MTTNKDNIYSEITKRLNYRESPYLARLLRKLMTPEDCEMLLALPAMPAELSAKFGLDETAIERKLQEFKERGLVIPSKGELKFAKDIARLHDSNLSSAEKWVDAELLDLWREFYEKDYFPTIGATTQPQTLGQPFIRIIPAWKAIEQSRGISDDDIPPQENIRQLINSAELISVVPCTCRRAMRRCDLPVEVCLQFNSGAEYAISRNAGVKISAQEAIEIADKSAEAGLIHTWPFPQRFVEICNCCRDCCQLFDACLSFGTAHNVLAKSHFRAEIDKDTCIGCEECVDRCFFGAIQMNEAGIATVTEDKCFGCGLCVVGCSIEAITMKKADL